MEASNSQKDSSASKCVVEDAGSVQFSDSGTDKSHSVSENIKIISSCGGCSVNDIPMSRESPDGSSDSCEWPTTSPTDHSSIVRRDGSSQSKIQDKDRGNITGARPKEIYMVQKLKNESSDLSDDNSLPYKCTSPSLLEVNYEREGDDSNSHCSPLSSHRIQSATCLPSDGRLMPTVTDSDQDSEHAVEETHPQARRRRRLRSLEQPVQLSHKALLRGVLKQNSTHHIRRENCKCDSNKHCKSCVRTKYYSHKSEASEIGDTSQEFATDPAAVPCSSSKKHDGHLHVSAPVPVTPSDEGAGGIACSAPISSIKQHSAPGKHTKKKSHSRSRSDGAQEIVSKLQFTHSSTDPNLENARSFPRLDVTKEQGGRNITIPERKRFMEDGGHSITPAADNGFFPRPQPGQSLIEFLSSKEFHKQNAALDKENAHFNISEAVIAALTQMQFDAWHQKFCSNSGATEDSDEEIRNLQAQIDEKRRQKLSGAVVPTPLAAEASLTADEATTAWVCASPPNPESTTDYSVNESPPSSCYNNESDFDSDEDWEDTLSELSGSSMKSAEMSFKSDLTAAENVAINLLKNFNEQRLPKASELEWLVSEEEAPQKLLPLPTSIAVGPEDGSGAAATANILPQPQLRGTSDWAPPRPQLVLTLLAPTKRSAMMKNQGWRCAGCGMKVSEQLSRHFRFCNYLGRYFCTTCHSNQTSIIPARVIHKWDFKVYPVSNFSLELIESMKCDPLFNVSSLNYGLYKKCRHLQQTHIYRLQLYHAQPYITTCSRAHNEMKMVESRPQHWASDPHAYSLEDLILAKNGSLVGEVKKLTKLCINHIAKCQVCAGRGFICEICGEGDPIFPFQLDSTALCATCSACYHVGCFCPLRCPRCIRRETRHLSEEGS